MYRFLFEARPHEGQKEAYKQAWRKGSKIIQQQPGALGTKLFLKQGEVNVFVAMADWTDRAARDAAIEATNSLQGESLAVVKAHQQLAEITPIGGFELEAEAVK